ncbi:MAG TPA: prephenate dehydrogenase/arogenate dehydrogenase family protein [Candidatus Bipolaricaulota bacterium]
MSACRFPAQLAIVGLGLIGGSLALATRCARPDVRIIGVDEAAALQHALGRKAIDVGYEPARLKQAVRQADLVILAAPISSILKLLEVVPCSMKGGAILTDVGSTKRHISQVAKEHVPATISFIGGHPLTGSEKGGFKHASAHLFQGAGYALCPALGSNAAFEKLSVFLAELGAEIVIVDPDEHDRVLAFTSHLPQLVAVGLADLVLRRTHPKFCGPGFAGMTRIASSPFAIWGDVFSTNARNVTLALDEFIEELQRLRGAIGRGELRAAFERAQRLLQDGKRGEQPFAPTDRKS